MSSGAARVGGYVSGPYIATRLHEGHLHHATRLAGFLERPHHSGRRPTETAARGWRKLNGDIQI